LRGVRGENGFSNLDYLLEQIIYPEDAFNALVIIDELEEELEEHCAEFTALPCGDAHGGAVPLGEWRSGGKFEPFLYDMSKQGSTAKDEPGNTPAIDPAEIDTIVVPAREDGFKECFLGENAWRAIRIHSSMIPKVRYLAAYQVAPVSAITYVAEVARIEPWKNTGNTRCISRNRQRRLARFRWARRRRDGPQAAPLHGVLSAAKGEDVGRCVLKLHAVSRQSDRDRLSASTPTQSV